MSNSLLLSGGRVLPISGPEIEGGEVLVENGKIKAVGKSLPTGAARKIDVTGKYVIPGFVDAHCHIGMFGDAVGFEGEDGNECTDPVTPHLRAIDAIYPTDQPFEEALQAGVTTAVTGPGSANVLGGTFAAIKTYGNTVEKKLLRQPIAMKCAFGENPKRVYDSMKKSPSTRMATAAILRETLFRASEYLEKKEAAGDDLSKRPPFDIKMESLIPVLKREIPLKAHAHRADDIMTSIRIAEEFNVRITLDHCTEGHLITEEIVARKLPAIVGPTFGSRTKIELKNTTFETIVKLTKAGVKTAIMTDSPVIPLDSLPLCAKFAIQHGLSKEEALRCITLNAAEIAEIADRVGSLEPGKDADIVVFDRHPMDFDAKVEMVIVDGAIVYERKDK
ncbi:MAG TPA: amidohydrolase [Firmicutes bacterium]|nr:amidohydrolase [Bacillota bacterium]HAW70672.1 amidohydrolase [Bacillota bacterium]HAZ21120.1 amidohydrolase [Bacillota bacterium]HBE06028.1 amidohydrolase [Bacillota bacterium]HBG42921.1 amidohydrolase [Bacillota bacterium]